MQIVTGTLAKMLFQGTLLVCVFLAADCLTCSTEAQEPARVPTVSQETYNHVIDLVFPRDTGDFRDFKKELALTLRFMPSFGAGSQVTVTKHSDGRLRVIAYSPLKSIPSIAEQLNLMLRETGREDAQEMAKRLNVQQFTVTDTSRVRDLLRRFALIRFNPVLDTSINLDQTGFELWFDAVSNKSYYLLVGHEPGRDGSDHPLVRWMNQVRLAVFRSDR